MIVRNRVWLITIIKTRLERERSCFRPIYNFRPERNPQLLRQNQPIRSSEEVAEELMKHGYIVGRVGLDATRRRVTKLSKVVFHNAIFSDRQETDLKLC